ncbi:MAG: sulfite exporter TauE/SafE family protein [Cyanobacteria bacterium J06597_1]
MPETIAIFFCATLLRAIFGFGDALIAMPLLTLTLGLGTATPLFALIATSSSLTIFISTFRQIDFKISRQLVFASILGIPFGLILIKLVPEAIVMRVLGVFLIVFAFNRLIRKQAPRIKNRWWGYGFGFVAGVLGSAFNTNGPPIVTYAALRQWPPDSFRSNLQGYFFPIGLMIVASHGISGLWTVRVGQLYLACLPAALAVIAIGSKVHQTLSPKKFETLLSLLLVILGVVLMI